MSDAVDTPVVIQPVEATPTHSQVWNDAIERSLLNSAYGLVGGGITALLLFRAPTSRALVLGTAIGVGLGYSLSQNEQEFAKYKIDKI